MTLANDNLRWLDYPLLSLDRQLALSIGYAPDPLEQVFVGDVVGHEATFPSTGTPTLTIVAQDKRHWMQRGNRTRWFAVQVPDYGNLPIPDAVVSALVSAERGMLPTFDPVAGALAVLLGGAQVAIAVNEPDEGQRTIRRQAGESDFDFLARINRENGLEMVVDYSGPLGGYRLRFTSPADHLSADVRLKWGRDLIEFTPRITTVGQVAGVTIPLWIPSLKTELTVSVGWDWDRQSLDLSISPGFGMAAGGANAAQYTLIDQPVTLANAPQTILGELLPRLNRRLTASGSTIGDSRLRAASVLQIEGVGTQLGGLYRATSVTQTFDSGGWRTSFEARKEIWFSSIPLPSQGAVPIRLES
jgi:hypothetical protein